MKLARPHADVLVLCADLDAALAFWREIFGFECIREDAARASVRVADQRIRLLMPHPIPPRRSGALYAGTGHRVLALIVDELDEVCRRLAAQGRRVAESRPLPGHHPIRFARDADGNMLELIGAPRHGEQAPLDRLQIGSTVVDSHRMRQFYGGALGLPEQPALPMADGMTRHAFSAGRTTLKFWSRSEPLPSYAGPPAAALGLRAICLSVTDLDRTIGDLQARGIAVSQASGLASDESVRWIQDPEDNWIELSEPC